MAVQKSGRLILVDAATAGVDITDQGTIDIDAVLLDATGAADAQIYSGTAVVAANLLWSGRLGAAGSFFTRIAKSAQGQAQQLSGTGLFVVLTGAATPKLFIYVS